MTTLKEEAQACEPKRTLNIADLDRVDISLPVEDRVGTDKDGKEFRYKVMVENGIDYRVPFTVLEEIKKMLTLKSDLTHVKVTQSGSGLNTRYSVHVA
jgi:hypothetical protein